MNANATRIYNKLLPLDRGMAEAFKSFDDKNFATLITPNQARRLFAHAADGDKITEDEAKALVVLIKGGYFEEGAKEALVQEIKKKGKPLLLAGAGTELVGPQRNGVIDALSPSHVKHIHFRNPFGHQYLPDHYTAVAQLIYKSKIRVHRVAAHGLNGTNVAAMGGAYHDSNANRLVVYSVGATKSWKALVIHEATHAVQDWRNITASGYQVKHLEADAYTAQAIASYSMGQKVKVDTTAPISPVSVAYHGIDGKPGTAELLWKRTNGGGFSQKAFDEAYEALAEVVAKHPIYKNKAKKARDFGKDAGSADEGALFGELVQVIRDSKN